MRLKAAMGDSLGGAGVASLARELHIPDGYGPHYQPYIPPGLPNNAGNHAGGTAD
jgi:hypothetical protein